MTQEQVAEQVGVKPNYIGYLERGLRKPSDEICCRIADVLGLERTELFFLANPHVRAIIDPPDEPSQTAWERFRRDRQLHTRQSISEAEMRVLESLGELGEVREPRDYLFILAAIRQSLGRG
jgi:transcriptional regulator with XRE-family HTH domain